MNDIPENETPAARAIAIAGGPSAVAEKLCLSAWAVSKWRKKIPAERVLALSALGGWIVTPHMIDPDIYPHPEDGLPNEYRRNTATAQNDNTGRDHRNPATAACREAGGAVMRGAGVNDETTDGGTAELSDIEDDAA